MFIVTYLKWTVLILLALPLTVCAHSQPLNNSSLVTKCGSNSTAVPWKYCVTKTHEGDDTQIIYYLHGGGGNQKSWIDPQSYSAQIRKIWKSTGFKAPTVVTISFGTYWLLVNQNGQPQSGLYDFFIKEVIPHVESNLVDKPPTERMLLGESMGGFNAAQLALKSGNLFKKAALLCPMLYIPYPSESSIEKYVKLTGGQTSAVKKIAGITNGLFPSEQSAMKEMPLTLAQQYLVKESPQFYISCGRQDEFGFFYGAEKFTDIAIKKGLTPLWLPLQGKHCSVDIKSVAEFLTN
jgi:pimeloyl-ACP methyl ester carboxylesterase